MIGLFLNGTRRALYLKKSNAASAILIRDAEIWNNWLIYRWLIIVLSSLAFKHTSFCLRSEIERRTARAPFNSSFMYLSEPCDQLFAYKCENDNRCLFKVMNGKFIDCNSNYSVCDKKLEMGDGKETVVNGKVCKEVRNEEVLSLKNKFPNKVPVIIKRFSKEAHLPMLDKSKFLVPQEITMSQFQTLIRSRLRMGPNQALYLLVNNRSMLSLSLTLAEVYSEYAGPDGFLYITYASQEVFGAPFATT